jgi:hypothetical protein
MMACCRCVSHVDVNMHRLLFSASQSHKRLPRRGQAAPARCARTRGASTRSSSTCQHAFKFLTFISIKSACQHTGACMSTCISNHNMHIKEKSHINMQPLFLMASVIGRDSVVRTSCKFSSRHSPLALPLWPDELGCNEGLNNMICV